MAETANQTREALLDVRDLSKHYALQHGMLRHSLGTVRAVDRVGLTITSGETLGLVGESGSGKSTLGKCILRGVEPTSGEVWFRTNGTMTQVTSLDRKQLQRLRASMQMIFQDPYSSLSPRMTIMDTISEPLRTLGAMSRAEVSRRVRELVDMTGLSLDYLRRYPHAFSGGQRQRIGIARALACRPRFVVADEPVSALDVSVQAQILNLIMDLKSSMGLTMLFISHDISVVRHISDRIAVMYAGRIVETASTRNLFARPMHPYTEALLSAVPVAKPGHKRAPVPLPVEDEASGAAKTGGCSFYPRCRYRRAECAHTGVDLKKVKEGHLSACLFADELQLNCFR